MKKTTLITTFLACLWVCTACDGIVNVSSQTSSKSETNISENRQSITNGDTTISSGDRKEKSNSESENKTRIGFSVDDKTGITDAIRDSLKKGKDVSNEDDKNTPSKKNKKPSEKVELKNTIPCGVQVSGDVYENLKAKIQKIQMDNDKLRKGKEFFNDVCITSKQAQDLISNLSLENYKLDFAKFLYGRTIDKAKFMRVADEFSFEETKKKLQGYITD